jgi:hypothetical protein
MSFGPFKWTHIPFLCKKADDDTYVIVENLRFMLHNYTPSEPIWFGCKYQAYVQQGYMSGGAGYVLSRGALDKFVNHALTDSAGTVCRTGVSFTNIL